LHEGFLLSPLCSSNNSIIKVKMGIEQWWNDTDNEKPKCSEKTPCGRTKNHGIRGEKPAPNFLSRGMARRLKLICII